MKKLLNILMGVLMAITAILVVYALISPHSDDYSVFDPSVNLNIIWCYILFVLAVISALVCATTGMLKNPAGVKGTLISLLLIIVIIGASYFYSAGHEIKISDMATGGYFGAPQTILSETSLLVTYVIFVCAVLTTVYSEIAKALK
ncbi:MAG: hypothetical protein RR330_07515 [Alistipes sp.]